MFVTFSPVQLQSNTEKKVVTSKSKDNVPASTHAMRDVNQSWIKKKRKEKIINTKSISSATQIYKIILNKNIL